MEFNLNYEKNIIEEIDNICYKELKNKIYQPVLKLDVRYFPTKEPISFQEVNLTQMKNLKVGESWGSLFDCAWFRLSGKLDSKDLNQPLYLHLDLSGEALLYDKQGIPLKGFTNGSSTFDRNHGEPGKSYYQINDLLDPDGTVELFLDAGCNDLFGNLQDNGSLIVSEIVTKNPKIEELYYNNECLISYLKLLDKKHFHYQHYFQTLEKVKNNILYQTTNWLDESLKLTTELLKIKGNNPLVIKAMGHAHLDLAWLWPLRESKRKALRTFTNVFYLLEKNPEMVFVVSQPQQLIWVEETSPETFQKIKDYVKRGRIELVGGMFVESDTNLVGEESLARQFLYGINYFKEKFGVRVKNLWLPDVFGYTASLPEIMRAAELEYFLTIKISWNLVNRFPYHTMIWKGLDGSEVIAHMPPEGNYNSAILPQTIKKIADNYQQISQSEEVAALYGIGDGAGGPGDEHLERIARESRLGDLPAVEHGRADMFFEKLAKNANKFPVWQNELYLENHQGTYTSQSNVKKWNRYLENKLKALESYLVIKKAYQACECKLKEIWQEILLYQFHDIIPGSSIKRVYEEALARYEVLNQQLDQIINTVNQTYQVEPAENLVTFNHQFFDIELYEKVAEGYLYQKIAKMSTKVLKSRKYMVTNQPNKLETQDYWLAFDFETGMLNSIIDKRNNKELLLKASNRLQVYQDKGDGWNILDHYREQDEMFLTKTKTTIKYYESITEIINHYYFKESKVNETIIINKHNNMITFKHDVDWKNVGYMLRTIFDVDVKSDFATYDIQYGQIKRTTKEDDSISKAQFEACAHNWVNLSDNNYSVSLLNKSKYGHRIKGKTMEINLLRSTNYPCVNGDIDTTSYQYVLLLDNNNLTYDAIDNLALTLNGCYLRFQNEKIEPSFITIDQSNIEYSTLKEATDGSIILRLYEKQGLETNCQLSFACQYTQAFISNILEEEIEKLSFVEDNCLKLKFKPFEIITLKLK